MLHLHATVYADPETAAAGPVLPLRGIELATLVGQAGGPPAFLRTLPGTFDDALARLASLPRCDTEPDGFFLVTGEEQGEAWRLNGHSHELDDRLHRVELSGTCPGGTLDAVLAAIGWPGAAVVFELVREGVTLREPEFRRWAAAPGRARTA